MKNIFKSAWLLLCGVCIFTACEDDNDSNPVLHTPSTFVLNTPPYAASVIDLASSTNVELTWSQPDYGFPIAAQYQVQVSLDGTFAVSVEEASADASGATVADYTTLDKVYVSCAGSVAADTLARGLEQIAKWTEAEVPAQQTAYVRILSVIKGAASNVDSVYSNAIPLTFVPYYVELKDAAPQFWFFVGVGAVGNWDNAAGGYGESVIPLALLDGATYSKATGEGKFVYTGYFDAGQFKLVLNPGAWAPMWGITEDGLNGTLMYRATESDTDPACWLPTTAGYYTFSFDSSKGQSGTTVNVEPLATTPTTYASMEFVGDFNNWANDGVAPVVMTANSVNPHIWYCDVDITADGGAKFRTDSTWSNNWGGDDFPYGLTSNNNIPVKAGSYRVVFNDIDKCYYFFEK